METFTLWDWWLAVTFVVFASVGLIWAGLRWIPAVAVAGGIMGSLLAFVSLWPVA